MGAAKRAYDMNWSPAISAYEPVELDTQVLRRLCATYFGMARSLLADYLDALKNGGSIASEVKQLHLKGQYEVAKWCAKELLETIRDIEGT